MSQGGCCVYQSAKLIRVENPIVVMIYYVLMLALLGYVAVWQIWLQKGYQTTDVGYGAASAKVKGTAVNASSRVASGPWDVFTSDDLVFPDTEQNGLFITTSTMTTRQWRGTCGSTSPKNIGACTQADTTNCTANLRNWDSQGVLTGNCSEYNTCEVMGWCPLEDDDERDLNSYYGLGDFTIFLKVNLRFQKFDTAITNTINYDGTKALTNNYNLFKVSEIMDGAGTSIAENRQFGAIILASIKYDCDLDKDPKKCRPVFDFEEISNVEGSVSPGYNFRTTTYLDKVPDPDTNSTNADVERILTKRIGIRFIFVLEGLAGKFDMSALTLAIGSGLAILGLATVLTDFIMTRCVKGHSEYNFKRGEYILLEDGTTIVASGVRSRGSLSQSERETGAMSMQKASLLKNDGLAGDP